MIRRFVDAVEFELRMYSETANGIKERNKCFVEFRDVLGVKWNSRDTKNSFHD
jgi:hypothetical protein